ncbi:MAG: ATP-binding protein [Planctomycetota bacterium]
MNIKSSVDNLASDNKPSVNLSNQNFLNASWLLKLRWVAVVGQVGTILGSEFVFQIEIPMIWPMGIVIGLTVISNLFLTIWFRRWRQIDQDLQAEISPLPWNLILGLVLIMDMLSLTALLFSSGGPNNPFSLFFFVNLSLSALMLNRRWAWSINLLGLFCFFGLMFEHHQVDDLDAGLFAIRTRQDVSIQHVGTLFAFATCSSVIVYFITRLTDALEIQQQEVRRAQDLQANTDKIEALGTLAAGTAHELATPLSTIAVVARDVEHAFEKHQPDFPGAEDIAEDVHLIRSQLDRCRAIIDRMASHAGQAIGESLEIVTIEEITNAIVDGIQEPDRLEIKHPESAFSHKLKVPLDGLSQAIRGLVQNGIDSDSKGNKIQILTEETESSWNWIIRDRGEGMSAAQLRRVSEPFFTTKEPGKGMGLGVFLAKNVVRRLGGSVEIESTICKGTKVTVRLPK